MNHETHMNHDEHCHMHHHHKRISWSAIFVGAFVGIGLSFLLNLFAVAIGLSSFKMNADGMVALAIGGLIAVAVAVFIAMLIAGFAAGYLGQFCCPERNLGMLYGFTTWTVALILSALVTAHVGNYMSSYSNSLAETVYIVPDNANMDQMNQNQMSMNNTSKNNAKKSTSEATNTSDNMPSSATNTKNIKIAASPTHLAWSGFIVFALFLLGAIASCIGACWGMGCKHKHHVD